MHNTTYSVYPRFTPGSPAAVDHETALKIASEERAEHEWLLRNPSHPDNSKLKLGIAGIVLQRWEVGRNLYTRDLLTGQISFRTLRSRTDPRSGATLHEYEPEE